MSQRSVDLRGTDVYSRSKGDAGERALDERADDTRGQETGMRSSNKRRGEGARLVRMQRVVA